MPRPTLHKSGKSLAVTALGTELASRAMTGQRSSNIGSAAAGAGTVNGSMCGAQLNALAFGPAAVQPSQVFQTK